MVTPDEFLRSHRYYGCLARTWLGAEAMAHRPGETIAGCVRSQEALDELSARFPAPHSFRGLDVTSAADVRDWADSVIAQQGAPDLVVCNASIVNDASKRAWELSDEEFDQVGLDGQHSGESATVPLPGYVL